MTEILRKLYYIVEDRIGQHEFEDETEKELMARQDALQEEIILRLGEDGREMMEHLADLNIKLETIHDQALFRAAMQLGTQIAQPGGVYSTSR